MRLVVTLLIACFAACFSVEAQAQDFVGTRALSLGESYRAIATGNDAIYLNPAGLPLLKRYAIEAHYLMNLVDEKQAGHVSVVDARTLPLATGLAYSFQGNDFSRRTTWEHTATLAFGYPFVERLFSAGVGLKYKNVSDIFAGNYLNALAFDAGALAQIPGGLSFAAVGYNLLPLSTVASARLPLSAGFAGAWDLGPLSAWLFGGAPSLGSANTAAGVPAPPSLGLLKGPLDGLTVSFDWAVDFQTLYGNKSRLSSGIEYLLAETVPVRAGWWWSEAGDEHRLSIGTGVIVPSFGFDVAFQQSVTTLDRRVLSFAVKGFFSP